MCIIVAEELEAERQAWLKVTKTKIFARHTYQDYQAIVYSMSIASNREAAMILPLPIKPGSGEDALKFIDLSDYPTFFDDLDNACPCECSELDTLFDLDDSLEMGSAAAAPILTVHEVGDYEASYVPSMADFSRLDPRFRLPEAVWSKMPDYHDYGFAVFQLKIALVKDDEDVDNTVHPMAFEFPTRDPDRLFYPTVHVHDGDYHSKAGFYHKFFCQRESAREEFKYQRDIFDGISPTPALAISKELDNWFEGYSWFYRSEQPLEQLIECHKTQGLIHPQQKLFAMDLFGNYPNHDMWLGDTCTVPQATTQNDSQKKN